VPALPGTARRSCGGHSPEPHHHARGQPEIDGGPERREARGGAIRRRREGAAVSLEPPVPARPSLAFAPRERAGAGLPGQPFRRRVPAARTRRRKPSAAPADGQSSILLVDDNRDITDVLARTLRSRGHAVEVAYDGSGALVVARRFRPRFAIIDIGLPEMDGYQLVRKLKRIWASSPPTLLALTGYGQLSDRKRALRAGFSDHLVKPIDLERLFAILEA